MKANPQIYQSSNQPIYQSTTILDWRIITFGYDLGRSIKAAKPCACGLS